MKFLDIYQNQLGSPLKLKLIVFSVLGLFFGAKALWNVDHIELPVHYLLFLIPGVMLGMFLNRIDSDELVRVNKRIAQRLNFIAIAIVITWLVIVPNYLPPHLEDLLEYPNVAMELLSAAFLLARVGGTWTHVREFIANEHRRHSAHLL